MSNTMPYPAAPSTVLDAPYPVGPASNMSPPIQTSDRATDRSFRRSRSGCFTCRLRRKKCDETRPTCNSCAKLALRCDYKPPHWWATAEERQKQKDRIKDRIRQTKVMEKHGSLKEYMDRIRALVEKPAVTPEYDFNRPVFVEQPNPLAAPISTQMPLPTPITTPTGPYDISVKTNTFVNSVPVHNDSPISAFNGMNPAQPPMHSAQLSGGQFPSTQLPGAQMPSNQMPGTPMPFPGAQYPGSHLPGSQFPNTQFPNTQFPNTQLPNTQLLTAQLPTPQLPTPQLPTPQLQTPQFNSDDWFNSNSYLNQLQPYSPMDAVGFGLPGRSLSSCLQTMVPIEESDRPLLNHFFDHVIRLVFPIVEVNQGGPTRVREILNSLQNNKSYLHCCLSVAAIHLKTSMGMEDQMDHDIMQHRYEAISQLCRALNRGTGQMQVMDATLALIFYHSSLGLPDDYLPDITWNSHFKAVANLVKKLNYAPTQFNVSLISWIDILGSTMLGETPQFAHTYRTKHLGGTPSGLQQLMGCDDRIMYLISEIACLDSLKIDGHIDDMIIRHHISALSAQIDWTEPTDPITDFPYTATGVVIPEKLSKILTALFRIGARIYLYSLIPGFDRHEHSFASLVASVADLLQYLPSGPSGFDRCVVWPLFMAGAHSTPSSNIRKVITERVAAQGYLADFGGFGRMYRVLKALWRVPGSPAGSPDKDTPLSPLEPPAPNQQYPSQQQYVHWREVMRKNKWNYLLL